MIHVRTGNGHQVPFMVDLGQRNAIVRRGISTPLRRVVSWGEAITVFPERGIDLVHTINAVPLTRKPHVITFEDHLPRTPPDTDVGAAQRAIRPLLRRERCVRLLAMSDYAIRQFRRQNRDLDDLAPIEAKMELFHPTIAPRASAPKPSGDVLRLLFVGRDFMRKGLPALLRAHRVLLAGGVPVETHVISGLEWEPGDYIGPSDPRMVGAARDGLNGEGVIAHGALPNDAALELMRTATFLVFPTLHDTFGFVALEAMAAGTPVIATRTCALPEVVDHGVSGYLLALDNDRHVGKWVGTYQREDPRYSELYAETVDRLGDELGDLLLRFWETSRPDYEAMSLAALETIRSRFDPVTARNRLETIYAEAVG